jgi:hypothetical protein
MTEKMHPDDITLGLERVAYLIRHGRALATADAADLLDQAREAMTGTEPFVQPPTREQIAHAWMQHLGYTAVDIADAAARSHVGAGCEWDWNHQVWECEDENGKSNHPAYDDLVTAYAMADAVLALFSQPTPGVVHFAPYGSSAASDGTLLPRSTRWDVTTGEYQDGEPFTVKRDRTTCPDCRARFTAEPVSIADMTPGTTFVDSEGERWTIRQDRDGDPWANSDSGDAWDLDDFDPSTIRDVTPPPATPEEGDH